MRIRFAWAIVAFWAGSYVVSIARSDYTSLSLTTPLMLMAGAYLLGGKYGNGKT